MCGKDVFPPYKTFPFKDNYKMVIQMNVKKLLYNKTHLCWRDKQSLNVSCDIPTIL